MAFVFVGVKKLAEKKPKYEVQYKTPEEKAAPGKVTIPEKPQMPEKPVQKPTGKVVPVTVLAKNLAGLISIQDGSVMFEFTFDYELDRNQKGDYRVKFWIVEEGYTKGAFKPSGLQQYIYFYEKAGNVLKGHRLIEAVFPLEVVKEILDNIDKTSWCLYYQVEKLEKGEWKPIEIGKLGCIPGSKIHVEAVTAKPKPKEEAKVEEFYVGQIEIATPTHEPWTLVARVRDVKFKGRNVILKIYASETDLCPKIFGEPCTKLLTELVSIYGHEDTRKVASLGIVGVSPQGQHVKVCFTYKIVDIYGNTVKEGSLGCIEANLKPGLQVAKTIGKIV